MRANDDCTKYGIATRAEGEKQSKVVTATTCSSVQTKKRKLHQFEVFKVEPKYCFADYISATISATLTEPKQV